MMDQLETRIEKSFAPEDGTKSAQALRVLVVAHAHPELSKGGGEISAFELFRRLLDHENCEAWFLGCDTQAKLARLGAVIVQPFSDREYLYTPGEFAWFNYANRDPRFPAAF